MSRSITALLKGVLTLFAAAGALSAPAAAAQAQLLDLETALAAQTVSLGEAIVLDYRIVNPASFEAHVYLGEFRKEWLTLSLVDGAGQPVPAVTAVPPLGKQALQGRAAYISPRDSYPGHLVVNQWFAVSRPGSYRLDVRVGLKYVLGPHAGQVAARHLRDVGDVLERNYSFPFTVTQTNPDRLRAVAESIRADLSRTPNVQRTRRLVESLFSMPAAYAAPTWRALVNASTSDPLVTSGITGRLTQFPSPEAADFLAWMAWDSNLPNRGKPFIKNALRAMHDRGNAAIRRHVEQIFIRRQGSMPTGPPVDYY